MGDRFVKRRAEWQRESEDEAEGGEDAGAPDGEDAPPRDPGEIIVGIGKKLPISFEGFGDPFGLIGWKTPDFGGFGDPSGLIGWQPPNLGKFGDPQGLSDWDPQPW